MSYSNWISYSRIKDTAFNLIDHIYMDNILKKETCKKLTLKRNMACVN